MCGRANPSPGMLRRLYGVRRTKAEERVMPAEVKVLGWSKGERSGMVVRGGGRDTVRVGGRVPLGEGVEYVYSHSLWSTAGIHIQVRSGPSCIPCCLWYNVVWW